MNTNFESTFDVEEQHDIERNLYRHGVTKAAELEGVPYGNIILRDLITEDWDSYDWKSYIFYDTYNSRLAENSVPTATPSGPVALPEARPEKGRRIGDLIPDYIGYHQTIAKPWSPKTSEKFKQQVLLFAEFLGNPFLTELDAGLIRDRFGRQIMRLPLNIAQKKALYFDRDQRKPLEEILQIADKNNAPRISSNTAADYVKNSITFLNWLLEQEYIEKDLTRVLMRQAKANRDDAIEKGLPDSDVKAIFESKEYQSGELMRHPERHWAPLIAIYTGAREGEICQLHVDDIVFDEETSMWLIDFNAKGTKRLKNRYSERVCPIHKDLNALGFLYYVQYQRQQRQVQLFPKVKPDKYGHWGKSVSRWFNGEGAKKGFKEKCGIVEQPGDRKNFHSFRHNVIDYAKQKGLNPNVIREVTGHAVGRKDVHSQNYEKAFDLANRKKAIDAIKVPFDVSLIKRWR